MGDQKEKKREKGNLQGGGRDFFRVASPGGRWSRGRGPEREREPGEDEL